MPLLTWRQFKDWQQVYTQEPWGEARDDQRAQAQTAWLKSPVSFDTDNLPDMLYPYWTGTSQSDLMASKKLLDQRKAEYQEKKAQRKDLETLEGG